MIRFSTGVASNVSIGSGSTQVLEANGGRQYCLMVNDSDEVMYLNLGSAATLHKGIPLMPNGGALELTDENLFVGAAYAICASGAKNLSIFEG